MGNETDLYIDGYDKYEPTNILELATYINSCKYFVGNQSSPFAIANALDVPRLGILDLDHNNYIFYNEEAKYSKNIQVYF
jgi:ADP-heptose:LPS heptosyltransferase